MLIAGAEIAGRGPLDVRITGGRIAEIATGLEVVRGESMIEAGGGALLPGLHDHHLHLFALAAADASVRCGPPQVNDRDALAHALAHAPGDDWIRGVGYHESVAGDLDRDGLDAMVRDRPVRVQHRTGAMWVVNSTAAERLGLYDDEPPRGLERGPDGRATGRLYRLDSWLRERLGPREFPSLRSVGKRLASYGVTGLSDATPTNGSDELAAFTTAVASGDLPQALLVMGSSSLPTPTHPGIERGALKLILAESELPGFAELSDQIVAAHGDERPVAIHCVTRVELVLATAAFAAAGCRAGDRIEHASVTPPDTVSELAGLPLTVVTQPGFVRERGDAYLRDVERGDRPFLYRCRGLVAAGIPLGAGTDAPFGHPDPWLAMRTAVDRRTADGQVLGADEALSPEGALALFTSPPGAPGALAREVEVGERADLCLLDRPWSKARDDLSSANVAATLRDGELIWAQIAREVPVKDRP